MDLKPVLKRQKKVNKSAILQLFKNEDTGTVYPNAIILGTVIIGEYGKILEQYPKIVVPVSDKLLPYSKKEIEKSIELLLEFLKDANSHEFFKSKYPEISKFNFTKIYYSSLRSGYIELANFINEEDAKICLKGIEFLDNKGFKHDTIKKMEDLNLNLERVIEIKKSILLDTQTRNKKLNEKFGDEDINPFNTN